MKNTPSTMFAISGFLCLIFAFLGVPLDIKSLWFLFGITYLAIAAATHQGLS
jgi:hypothetical protein